MDESKLYENEVLQLYIQSGWNVLNKARTGINNSSLGSSEYKWTKRKCYEAAKSCSSKSELNKKYPTVYSKALKKGWINDYTWFNQNRNRKWTYESCYEEAKKYNTIVEFCEKNHTAYQTSSINRWINNYYWFKKIIPKHPPRKWWYESCKKEAQKYSTKTEFALNAKGAFAVSIKNGWISEFFPKNHKINYQ